MVSVVSLCGRSPENLVQSGPDTRSETPTRNPKEVICVEVPACISPLLIARLARERMLHASLGGFENPSVYRLPKSTAVVEPVEGSGRPLGLCGQRLPELNFIPIQVIDPGKATVGFVHSFGVNLYSLLL